MRHPNYIEPVLTMFDVTYTLSDDRLSVTSPNSMLTFDIIDNQLHLTHDDIIVENGQHFTAILLMYRCDIRPEIYVGMGITDLSDEAFLKNVVKLIDVCYSGETTYKVKGIKNTISIEGSMDLKFCISYDKSSNKPIIEVYYHHDLVSITYTIRGLLGILIAQWSNN